MRAPLKELEHLDHDISKAMDEGQATKEVPEEMNDPIR
jgi:hypothetical protein